MPSSLEYNVETYFAQLLATASALSALAYRHFDDRSAAVAQCIIIEATEQEKQLEGPAGKSLQVKITYRSDDESASANDTIEKAIRETIVAAHSGQCAIESVFAAAGGGCLYLYPEEIIGDRPTTKNMRERELTIPVLAALSS